MWARHYAACIDCGTTERKHFGAGARHGGRAGPVGGAEADAGTVGVVGAQGQPHGRGDHGDSPRGHREGSRRRCAISHLAKIQVQVKDLEALKAACARLGFEFLEGQQTFACYPRYVGDTPLPEGFSLEDWGKCSNAIRVPGANYEVGVVQQGDHYALLWDYWGPGGLGKVLGKDGGKLVQAYTVEAALAEISRQGMSAWEEALEDGSVRLHVEVAS